MRMLKKPERRLVVCCYSVLLLCALNPSLLPAQSFESVGAPSCWGGPHVGRASPSLFSLHFPRLRGAGSEEEPAVLLDQHADEAEGGPNCQSDQQDKAMDPSDDTLELQLQHDAAALGDAQSLCDYADFLQGADRDVAMARKLYARALQLEPASVRTHCSFGRLLHSSDQLDAGCPCHGKRIANH